MSRLVPIIANTPVAKASASHASLDIESIVRRVLERLRETNPVAIEVPPPSASIIHQPVFSLEDVRGIATSTRHIVFASKTVITPAARDELRQREISFERSNQSSHSPQTKTHAAPGTRAIGLHRDGSVSDGLFSAVKKQALARGVRLCNQASVTVILSDRPATTAHSHVSPDTCVASINRVDDVSRFLAELSPNVFVLDVMHLHLVSLARCIVMIAKPTTSAVSTPVKVTGAGGLS